MGVNHRYNLDMSSVRVTGVQKTLLLHVTLVLYFIISKYSPIEPIYAT